VVDVGVAYGSDVTRAMAIVAQIAEADEKVIADPAPFVTFEGFGDSTLNLRLRCYLDDIEARVSTMSRLRQGINERFSAEGIEIAFPQVDVHFDHNRPLSIRIERD
jgi:potassium efflux system protein